MPTNERYSAEQIRKFQQLLIGARKSRSLTQTEAAEEIGVSQALISSLERGPSSGMRVGELFKVLGYYGIKADDVSALLGYLKHDGLQRDKDPRVRDLLLRIDAVPVNAFETIMDSLDYMLKGALTSR